MIKQKGFLRLLGGSLGETTFLKSRDGYRAQEKKVLPKGKFQTDPAFEQVRETNARFSTAAKVGKLLRRSINPLVTLARDPRSASRLLHVMMTVLKADTVSPPGKQNFLDGNVGFLKNFQFNAGSTTDQAFGPTVLGTINRVTGELSISIPSFNPIGTVHMPGTATHFEIVTAGVELDIEGITFKADTKTAGILPYGATPLVVNDVHTLTANSTHPLMLVFGVRFYQLISGAMRPHNGGKENALKIVTIEKP